MNTYIVAVGSTRKNNPYKLTLPFQYPLAQLAQSQN